MAGRGRKIGEKCSARGGARARDPVAICRSGGAFVARFLGRNRGAGTDSEIWKLLLTDRQKWVFPLAKKELLILKNRNLFSDII